MIRAKTLGTMCLAVFIISTFAWSFKTYLSLPQVVYSYHTRECVEVRPAGTCDNIPKRYVHRWAR